VAGPGFVSLTIFSRTVADRTPDSAPRENWILFAVLMIFALSLGCLGGVVIGGFIVKATVDDDSDDDTFSEGPRSQPNQIVTRDELVKCISTQTPDGDSYLSESTSPHGKAFKWLLQDLNSKGAVSDQRKVQRYSLGTI
jgi:hypothetical protein